jgi:lipid A 4'-phosphatase
MVFPKYDIIFSSNFYSLEGGFFGIDSPFAYTVFKAVPIITQIWSILCALLLCLNIVLNRSLSKLLRSSVVFLLFAALIGPALVVSYGFKEHIGRARPKDIIEFGGHKNFTAPFELSKECKSNCSFSSAHAAMGFYFTSLAWIFPLKYQNITFLLAFLFGSFVGLGRIMQGGHFLSDIVFSFVIVMIVNEVSYKFWLYLKKKMVDRDVIEK